ncbi:MAG: endonuclease, partial [Paludibacter sp.]
MKKLFTLFLLSLSIYIFAQEPTGYYNSAVGKSDATLRTSLESIITNGSVVLTYTPGLWNAYATTDINPATGKIWDMYSNCSFTWSVDQNKGTTGPECTNYNREHSVPNSWWGGVQTVPQYSDIVHLVPTDSYVNAQRGNNPYGEVGTPSYTSGNGSKLGSSSIAEYSGVVFEPINEYKGDFARIYFYIATRYASDCGTWTQGQGSVIFGTPTLGLS